MNIREMFLEQLQTVLREPPDTAHFSLPFDPENEQRLYRYICIVEEGEPDSPPGDDDTVPETVRSRHWIYGMDSGQNRRVQDGRRCILRSLVVGFYARESSIVFAAYRRRKWLGRYIALRGVEYPLGGLLNALDFLAFQNQHPVAAGKIIEAVLTICLQLLQHEDEEGRSSKPERLWRKILRHVYDHLDGDLSNQTLAAMLRVHAGYINTLCRQHTGKNFSTFVRELRMDMAAEMLHQGDAVKVVAEECGYHSVSYFSRHFKRVTGMTPGQCAELSSLP